MSELYRFFQEHLRGVDRFTCQDKVSDGSNESSQKGIIRECTDDQHVDELKDASDHDHGHVTVQHLERCRGRLNVGRDDS